MATLVQEIAGSADSWSGDQPLTMTFDLDFPPHGAFIKVVLGQFYQWLDNTGYGACAIGLVNMRRRKPDNSDETIIFPNIDTGDVVYVMFDPAMTHVTFGIMARNCSASLVWTHEVFV